MKYTKEDLMNTWGVVESKEHAEYIVKVAEKCGFEYIKSREGCGFFNFGSSGFIFLMTEYIASSGLKKITIPLPHKEKEWGVRTPPKHFDCVCAKCGGKCCAGFCDSNIEANKNRTFASVATIGEGRHKSRYKGKKTKSYKVWEGVITRCYVKGSTHYGRYGGRGVCVCDEWLNYQNFADWYLSQKNNSRVGFQLDKDLKVIGNKTYSPHTCEIVPSRVNSLLISTNSRRGVLPVGVHALKDKFKASCRDEFGSKIHLGTFKSGSEAFCAYKNFKKGVIVTIANNEFEKGNISRIVYDNLIKFEIQAFPD